MALESGNKFDNVFYNRSRLNEDVCAKEQQIRTNNIYGQYNLPKFRENRLNSKSRASYMDAVDSVGIYPYRDYDAYGYYINNDSYIRNGKIGNIQTHDKTRRQYKTRTFLTNQYAPPGTTSIIKPDVYSELISGELTRDKTSLRGVYIDRFVPLVPSLREEVQNPVHLIPRYWVRGGMDTRAVIRNIDYLKTCGLKK